MPRYPPGGTASPTDYLTKQLMCGIVGIVGVPSNPMVEAIRKMRDVFPYRGPDAKGLWVSESSPVGLGHRRLSILDLSDAGTQPMRNARGDLHVVFNGEIYNYLELRKELQGLGAAFRTNTDTEVLLAAYDHWGLDCLQRFNGMWGFALWDDRDGSLFLARDRLGVKPLYYFQSADAFYFASEVKAILAVLDRPPDVVDELVDAYMTFGYVPGEHTLLHGVRRLLPGHYLQLRDNRLCVRPYWELEFHNREDHGLRHYVEGARELLQDSIDLRLRSDVPVGVMLSGGLDSSTVVGLLATRLTQRVKTFSAVYDFGPKYNEAVYARTVANKFNTEHFELVIRPQEFLDFIPGYVWHMDEPVADGSCISLHFLSRLASDHVTVILSGEGADEVFGGYPLYRYHTVLERYRTLVGPGGARILARLVDRCLPETSKIAKYFHLGADSLEQRYKGVSAHDEHYKKSLYQQGFADLVAERKHGDITAFLQRLFAATADNDLLCRMLFFDTKTWLPEDLLIKADRMSMSASLELRVPFLDYRLVEFAAGMPSRYKVRGNCGKYILKEMMKGMLPTDVVKRRKMGWPTPLQHMFAGALQVHCREVLLSPSAQIHTYFRPKKIEELLDEHARRQNDHHRVIWQLLVLEHWLGAFAASFPAASYGAAAHSASREAADRKAAIL